jgi:hypothetical protein
MAPKNSKNHLPPFIKGLLEMVAGNGGRTKGDGGIRSALAKRRTDFESQFSYSYRDALDPTIELLYHPRSLTVLFALLGYFIYVAFLQTPSTFAVNAYWYAHRP